MYIQQWIQSIKANRSLSIQKLSQLLGYKSPTSLARILHQTASPNSIEQFVTSACQCDALHLNNQEKQDLINAYKLDTIGKKQLEINNELVKLIKYAISPSVPVIIYNGRTGQETSLTALYQGIVNVQITIYNCSYVPLNQWTSTMIRQQNAKIRHVFYSGIETEGFLHSMNEMLGTLFLDQYDVFNAKTNHDLHTTGLVKSDVILCSYEENDAFRTDAIIFDSDCHGIVIRMEAAPALYKQITENSTTDLAPIKQKFLHCVSINDYSTFVEQIANIEANKTIYRIKPDLPSELITPWILKSAFLNGRLMGTDGLEIIAIQLSEIYELRYANAVHKHKPSHLIMKCSAMRTFMKTGKLSDHPWMLRSFTVAERIDILKSLLELQSTNPYFFLYFLKNDDDAGNTEIALYEDVGLLLLPLHTNYDLCDNYGEILLAQSDLCHSYKAYYLQTLIKEKVMSEHECRVFLQKLLNALMTNPTLL